MAFDWERWRDIIRDLYLTQGKSLREIASEMERLYKLEKKKDAYGHIIRKWGLKKNVKSDEWKVVHGRINSRRKRNKDTVVYQVGRLIAASKLAKERRHDFSAPMEQYGSAHSPKTPEGFSICTPTPSAPPQILMYNLPTVQVYNDLLLSFRPNSREDMQDQAMSYQDISVQLLRQSRHVLGSRFLTNTPTLSEKIESISSAISEPEAGFLAILGNAGGVPAQTRDPQNHLLQSTPHGLTCAMMYAIVNSLLGDDQAVEVTRLFLSTGGARSLDNLLTMDLPAAKELLKVLTWGAVLIPDLRSLNALMKMGGRDLDMPLNRRGNSIPDMAVKVGHVEVVRLVLASGADPNQLSWSLGEDSHVMRAVRRGKVQIVRALIEHGADVNYIPDDSIYYPLDQAIQRGHSELIPILLEAGADVRSNPTPLCLAVRVGDLQAIDLMLKHGAHVDRPVYSPSRHPLWGRTALEEAARKGYTDIFFSLLHHRGGRQAISYDVLLESAAYGGQIEIVEFLVAHGADVNAGDALTAAARGGHIHMAKFLVAKGANVNSPASNSRSTPLQAALPMVRLLIKHGAEVHASSYPEELTTVQSAIELDELDVARLLLEHGAEIISPGGDDRRAWEAAMGSSDPLTSTQFLIEYGVHVNPLSPACLQDMTCEECDHQLINYLLTAGLHVDQRSFQIRYDPVNRGKSAREEKYQTGWTLLHKACSQGAMGVIELLLDWDADVNAVPDGYMGMTALQAAAGAGAMKVVRLLYEKGANVNAEPCDRRGLTALQAAAIQGRLDVVLFLLEHGADVNAPVAESEGWTAVEGAAGQGWLDILQLLLNVGGQVAGTRAREHALEGGYDGVVVLLDKHLS